MQISSNHAGFNFNSVYKSIVTRQVPALETPEAARDSFVPIQATDDKPDSLERDALLLKAAHRVAVRTVGDLESLQDL